MVAFSLFKERLQITFFFMFTNIVVMNVINIEPFLKMLITMLAHKTCSFLSTVNENA